MTAYRYTLERGPWIGEGTVLFVMLNPSTADHTHDDATIRRCVGFAQRWGRARLLVGNLYAWRATLPAELFTAADPVGPDNDAALSDLADQADEVIVAWGAVRHPFADRPRQVLELLGRPVRCLGRAADGSPRHPCRLPYVSNREPFELPGRA